MTFSPCRRCVLEKARKKHGVGLPYADFLALGALWLLDRFAAQYARCRPRLCVKFHICCTDLPHILAVARYPDVPGRYLARRNVPSFVSRPLRRSAWAARCAARPRLARRNPRRGRDSTIFIPDFNVLRIASLNLNGIRSAVRRGFLAWLEKSRPDIVCMQEIKAHQSDLDAAILMPDALRGFFHSAEKKGYAGVGLYCRKPPERVVAGFGSVEFDPEGRFLRADYGDLSVVSAYLPSGSSSAERQQAKFRFMREFMPCLERMRKSGREFIIAGDWNIAHREIDLKNWRANQKNSGFLPEERAWIGEVFEKAGWVDVFRMLDPRAEQYTWWSNRGQAWAKNVGWRIDYQIATPGVAATARRESIYKAKRFSDHAPLIIDYDHDL